jgi:regulator of replication initiation timing
MKKKYIVDGQVYEIPDSEAQSFLKDFPHAKVSYNVQGKEYEIPHQEADAFETDMGLKKKEQTVLPPTSKPVAEPLGNGLSTTQTSKIDLNPFDSFGQKTKTENADLVPQGIKNPAIEEPKVLIAKPKKQGFQGGGFEVINKDKKKGFLPTLPDESVFSESRDKKPIVKLPEEVEADYQKHKKNVDEAITLTTIKSLKNRGINVSENSPIFYQEEQKIRDKVKNGDLTFSISPTGEKGFKKNYGILEGFTRGYNAATEGLDEAKAFKGWTDQQRVDYVNEKAAQKPQDNVYLGERSGNLGSIGEVIGENVPFVGKAALGTAAAAMAAPTLGLSEVGLGAFGGFLATADDSYAHGAKDEVLRRYEILKHDNPNANEVDLMAEARQGEMAGGAASVATNALLMNTGGNAMNVVKKELSETGRKAIGQTIKNISKNTLKSAVHMANVSTGIEALKTAEGGLVEGVKEKPSATYDRLVDTYTSSLTTGALLSGVMGLGGLAKVLPKAIKSTFKTELVKNNTPQEIEQTLRFNEEQGNIPQGSTEKTLFELSFFKEALDKTPDTLTPEAQASYAGLVEKKTKLQNEMATKDENSQGIYKPQIEAIDKQLKEIAETNKPVEFDEVTGDKITQETQGTYGIDKETIGVTQKGEPENITKPIELSIETNTPTKTSEGEAISKPTEEISSTETKPTENLPKTEESQVVTFENVKEGDIIVVDGQKVQVVGKTKSRGGADVVEVKSAKRTKEEIRKAAVQTVINNKLKEYNGRKVTMEEFELDFASEIREAIEHETALENSRTATFTIDAEQWSNDVKAESQPKEQPLAVEAPTTNKKVEVGSVGVVDVESRSNTPIAIKKYNPNGNNEVLTGEDAVLAEARIEKIISTSKTVEEAKQRIGTNAANYVFSFGNETHQLNKFIQDRIDGKTKTSFAEWRKGKAVEQSLKEATKEGSVGVGGDVLGKPSERKGNALSFPINSKGVDVGSIVVRRPKDEGYTVSVVSMVDAEQGKGLGKKAYRELNALSINETGKPLKSGLELNDKSTALWESLVNSGEAEKTNNGYAFKEQSLKETPKVEVVKESESVNAPIEEVKKVIDEINSKQLTHVEATGMGAKQADGMYISTEPNNRYATKENPAKSVTVDIKNPKVTDYVENAKIQQEKLKQLVDENKITIEDISEEYREEIANSVGKEIKDVTPKEVTEWHNKKQGEKINEDIFDWSARDKAAKLITEQYKAEGHDALYIPQTETQEGELIVFDRKNVKQQQPEITESQIKKAQSDYDLAVKELSKAREKLAKTQSTQKGLFGGEQKGMFAVGAEEAKKALEPLKTKVKETKSALEDLQRKKEVQDLKGNPDLFEQEKVQSQAVINQQEAKKTYSTLKQLDTPTDARGLALEYFSGGGKLSEETLNKEVVRTKQKGSGLNVGSKESVTGERAARDYVEKNGGGKSIKEIANSIWNNIPEHLQDKISTEDIRNELIDVAQSFNKRIDIAKEYIDKYHPDKIEERMLSDEDFGRFYDLHEAEILAEEQRLNSLTAEEFAKEQSITESDEYINHIINKYQNELTDSNKTNESTPTSESKSNEKVSNGKGNEAIKEADAFIESQNKGTDISGQRSAEKPTEPNGDTTTTIKDVKDLGGKARDLAKKVRDNGMLPSWLKANLPKGTKVNGIDINEAFAKALETFADIHDATKDFAKAVSEGFKHIKDWFEENNVPYNEKELKDNFENHLKKGEDEIDTKGMDDGDTKMANAINDAHIKGKFGIDALDKVIEKLQDTNVKRIYEAVKEKIKNGTINPKSVRERLNTTKEGSEIDQAVLLYDMAELKGKESGLQKEIINTADENIKQDLQRKLVDVQNEMMDNALANRVIGRTASTIFRLRQLWVNRQMDVVDMQEQFKASKGIKELTPEQEQYIKDTHAEISKLRDNVDSTKAELDKAIEENARLKEENDKLKKLKDSAKNQEKSDRAKSADEKVQKSNERIKAAKENLRKLGGNLNAGFDPRIAIEISKIAAEKVYQGVVKFDKLVKDIYDDIKDVFPTWTEEDVVNHLLTATDSNGNIIPTLTSKKYINSKKLLDLSDKNLREKIDSYEKAQKEVAIKQYEWQKERRMDFMDKRSAKEKVIDSILRWQRFAVLSYPTTMVKLAAVVAQQLILKPLKFSIQKGVSMLTPESVKSKQSIFGSPKLSSLGKYYSAFIRNLASQNLKEHLQGIDTKELLYGKKMMYDEFNAATGLLDMPGRTHGYIKSFIKNPEFAYAHEQQMDFHINKMLKIQNELSDNTLSDKKREELQKEYDNNDITNEDVLERVNRLSLEHSKWSILMNDNKFVDNFRKLANEKTWLGALVKSEVPVIKIPVNYVGRAFAIKYGLIQAITGKGKDKMPSVIRIALEGTKDLTEEQANLLGRTIQLGSMGAAFFALGYIGKNKIEENDDGSFEIFGHHVSKNLIHSPEFESIASGAFTANKYSKSSNKTKAEWIKSFVESDWDIAKKNPFMNMLKYGFMSNVASALLTKSEDKGLEMAQKAAYKKIADMTIPGFIKQPAQWLDTKEKGVHPMEAPIRRTPQGSEFQKFWQTMELGLPYLRTNVPLTPTKSKSFINTSDKEVKTKYEKASEKADKE